MKLNISIFISVLLFSLSSCSSIDVVLAGFPPSPREQQTESGSGQETGEEQKKGRIVIVSVRENYWEGIEVDTASDASYLSKLEQEIILELNKVRTRPAEYNRLYIEPMRGFFQGDLLQYPGEIPIRTREGIAALEECIEVLGRTEALGTLNPSEGLNQAARDHADDQRISGDTGHRGSDGTDPFDRMRRYGAYEGWAGENIAYGESAARRIVIGLLIDDGVPGRGHRKNILNPDFSVVGVAHARHPSIRTVTVMDFASGFTQK